MKSVVRLELRRTPNKIALLSRRLDHRGTQRARRQTSHPFSVPSVPLWFFSSARALSARDPQKTVLRSLFTGSREVLLGALKKPLGNLDRVKNWLFGAPLPKVRVPKKRNRVTGTEANVALLLRASVFQPSSQKRRSVRASQADVERVVIAGAIR